MLCLEVKREEKGQTKRSQFFPPRGSQSIKIKFLLKIKCVQVFIPRIGLSDKAIFSTAPSNCPCCFGVHNKLGAWKTSIHSTADAINVALCYEVCIEKYIFQELTLEFSTYLHWSFGCYFIQTLQIHQRKYTAIKSYLWRYTAIK